MRLRGLHIIRRYQRTEQTIPFDSYESVKEIQNHCNLFHTSLVSCQKEVRFVLEDSDNLVSQICISNQCTNGDSSTSQYKNWAELSCRQMQTNWHFQVFWIF